MLDPRGYINNLTSLLALFILLPNQRAWPRPPQLIVGSLGRSEAEQTAIAG
jgi:hypothetical protein